MGSKVKGEESPSRQGGDRVRPGLDRGPDSVVLVGRDPDGLPGEGDVVVVTGRVVALELGVVGLTGAVPDGLAAHRESHLRCSRSAPAELRAYRSIAASRAALSSASAAFALKAAIVGDCRETLPTRFPSPSRKFTFAV